MSPITYNLHKIYSHNRKLISCFPAYKFLFHLSKLISSVISIFIQFNFTRRPLPLFSKQNRTPRIEPTVFLNWFYKKNIISFPQAKKIPRIVILVSPKKKYHLVSQEIKTTKRRQLQEAHMPPQIWINPSQYICVIMI